MKLYYTPVLFLFRVVLPLFLLAVGVQQAGAQVAGYAFTESAGTYTAIGGTVVHASGWNDPAPVSIPIPFTFTFDNVGYTACSVNGNGYITFGGTASAAAGYTPVSAATGYAGAVSAMGINLVSNASTVVYGTTGVTPNRIFIIQWNNCRRVADNVAGADWNFQIQLLETSNIVRVVYGACAATNATNTINAQVGLRGSGNTDFNNRTLSTSVSWANNTTAGIINSQTVRSRNTALPPSGRTFIWTPGLGPTNSCNPSGNVIIYSNYDGGVLNISVDQNIPNLKIGICTYEGTTINISGAFVGNVTAVAYAGYNANNAHCSGIINTSINGVPIGITSIAIYPPATLNDPNGNPNIDCAYQCNTGNQGGCNTAGQVAHYFLTQFGGSLRFHQTQYGCWTGTHLVSAGGNCCLVNQVLPVDLLYFAVQCGNKTGAAELRWETAGEINNDYFTIEKSVDGIYFQEIAQVNGAGTSSEHHVYSFTDNEVQGQSVYYRLRQTDFNGVSETFPLRQFHATACSGNAAGWNLWPNPANEAIVIQGYVDETEETMLTFTDASGKTIHTQNVLLREGWNTIPVNTSTLAQGLYIISVKTKFTTAHLKMMKQ